MQKSITILGIPRSSEFWKTPVHMFAGIWRRYCSKKQYLENLVLLIIIHVPKQQSKKLTIKGRHFLKPPDKFQYECSHYGLTKQIHSNLPSTVNHDGNKKHSKCTNFFWDTQYVKPLILAIPNPITG